MVGLDQENYTVNEFDGSLMVCVVLLEGSGIDNGTISIDVSVSVSSENATGIYL